MGIRFTEDGKWYDPWFRRLLSDHKLLFIFLCEVCDLAGFWEMDIEEAAYRTGLPEDVIEAGLDVIGEKNVKNCKYFWVRNYLKIQKNTPLNPYIKLKGEKHGEGNKSHIKIVRLLLEHKGFCADVDSLIESVSWWLSPMDGGSKGDASSPGLGKGIGINKNSNNTNNKKTKNTKKTKQLEKEFDEQFWPSCPNKLAKGAAREAFIKARKKADLSTIIAGLSVYADYEDGRRGQKDYRPLHPATWLNQERWEDERTRKTSSSGNGKRPIDTGGYRRGREEFASMGSDAK